MVSDLSLRRMRNFGRNGTRLTSRPTLSCRPVWANSQRMTQDWQIGGAKSPKEGYNDWMNNIQIKLLIKLIDILSWPLWFVAWLRRHKTIRLILIASIVASWAII